MRNLKLLVVAATATFLAACGGGGVATEGPVVEASVNHYSSVPSNAMPAASVSQTASASEATPEVRGPAEIAWMKKLAESASNPGGPATAAMKTSMEHATYDPKAGSTCVAENGCPLGAAAGKKTWVLIGDSHAYMWLDGLARVLGTRPDTTLVRFTHGQCNNSLDPAGILRVGEHGNVSQVTHDACLLVHNNAKKYLITHKPDLVIFSDDSGNMITGPRSADYLHGYTSFLELAKRTARSVVVLGAIPQWPSPSDCLNASLSNISRCSGSSQASGSIVSALSGLAKSASVKYLDPTSWLCVDKVCPLFIGTTAVTPDGWHLSSEIGVQLAGVLYEELTR